MAQVPGQPSNPKGGAHLSLFQFSTLMTKVGEVIFPARSRLYSSHKPVQPSLTGGGKAELMGGVTGHKAGLDGNGRGLVGGEQSSRGRAAGRWAGFRACPAC